MSRNGSFADAVRHRADEAHRRIMESSIRRFPVWDKELFLISDCYPGVWLEHTYDGIMWASMEPECKQLAVSQAQLFMKLQKPDGQLPCYVLDESNPAVKPYGHMIGYGQLQECVSFGRLCLKAYELTGDSDFLRQAYDSLKRWVGWQRANRMTTGRGLVETFCGYDAGHDNSERFAGLPGSCPDNDAKRMPEVEALSTALPYFCPDQNAPFYGNLVALSEMAAILGDGAGSEAFAAEAEAFRSLFRAVFRNEADGFYYDVDAMGRMSKLRSVSILNVITEGIATQSEVRELWVRYLSNPAEFGTPYPFPGLSAAMPCFARDLAGNDWGYYSQGLNVLRATLWMDKYGLSAEFDGLLEVWLEAYTRPEAEFGQELDPFTGEVTVNSRWMSAAMLVYLYGAKRLGYLE